MKHLVKTFFDRTSARNSTYIKIISCLYIETEITHLVEGIHWRYTKVGNGKTTYRSDKNIGRAEISVRNVLKLISVDSF